MERPRNKPSNGCFFFFVLFRGPKPGFLPHLSFQERFRSKNLGASLTNFLSAFLDEI